MQSRPYREVRVALEWASPGGNNGMIVVTAHGSMSSLAYKATTAFPDVGLLRTAGTANPLALDAPDNRKLTEALLCPEVLDLLTEERRLTGARIRLLLTIPGDAEYARLRAVPWELCVLGTWNESGFTSKPLTWLTSHSDVQIVRVVPEAATTPSPSAPLAGRVLLSAAYHVDGELGELRFRPLSQLEASDVEQARYELAGTALRPELVLPGPSRRSASLHDLRQAIGAGPVAGFYFAGHHGEGGLVVAGFSPDGDRSPEWLSSDDLAGLLLAQGIQVAVLMACDTGSVPLVRAREIAEHRAFAERLVTAGVPWVISAQGAVTNGATQRFAPVFWRWLASGAAIDEAACAGSEAMAGYAGLIVVHRAPQARDLAVQPAGVPASPILTRVPNGPGVPGQIVSLDVRWGLDRRPIRGILAAGVSDLNLTERLNRAEEIVRQGAFDFDRSLPSRRRQWFFVEAFRHPASLGELASRLGRPYLWHTHLADAPNGAQLGFVIGWECASEADVPGYLALLQGWLPNAAMVVRVSGREHVSHATLLRSRIVGEPSDLLLLDAADADGHLDTMIVDQGRDALAAAADMPEYAEDPDILALAALRNQRRVGWSAVEARVSRGVSTEVRTVAGYLARRGDTDDGDLTFMCEAEPRVVEVAWRAGIRPQFDPVRLPRLAVGMPGCWALLARSRLSPALVRWLYETGPPLASVTGLVPDAGPDDGYASWVAQAREAYGL